MVRQAKYCSRFFFLLVLVFGISVNFLCSSIVSITSGLSFNALSWCYTSKGIPFCKITCLKSIFTTSDRLSPKPSKSSTACFFSVFLYSDLCWCSSCHINTFFPFFDSTTNSTHCQFRYIRVSAVLYTSAPFFHTLFSIAGGIMSVTQKERKPLLCKVSAPLS